MTDSLDGGQAHASLLKLVGALVRSGRAYEALDQLQTAVLRGKPSAELLYAMADLQENLLDIDGALNSYAWCLRLKPDFAEAHNNFGCLLLSLGRTPEAIESFRAAVVVQPTDLRALANLGNALLKAAQPIRAAECLERALSIKPDYPLALCNLGLVRLAQDKCHEAADLFSRVIAIDSAVAEAHYGLGSALRKSRRFSQALASFDHAIALAPNSGGYLERGDVLIELGRTGDALGSYEQALALQPGSATAWHGRGFALELLGRTDEALDSYERALSLEPNLAQARWNLGLLRLLLGDFRTGWPLFESRLDLDNRKVVPARVLDCPRWHGTESLRGKRILVYPDPGETGLGDTIQFCRYVKMLDAAGAEVMFEVEPRLKSLLTSLLPGSRLIVPGDPLEALDYHCPLMSLPLAFGTKADSIPAEVRYLKADPGRIARWAHRLPGTTGLRIGVVWRATAKHETVTLAGRSIPLQQLERLFVHRDIVLVALQKGDGTEELEQVTFRDRIVSFGDALDEGSDAFLDTAAIMMHLDLVITVDTSVAHLAGALGVPVWVAVKTPCDWRWQRDRLDCPWYPTMRLFRQRAPRDWSTVIEDMATSLRDVELVKRP
jgi:tetratricopeptide (TPR) repeat protein